MEKQWGYGPVTISTTRTNQMVRLRVPDTGVIRAIHFADPNGIATGTIELFDTEDAVAEYDPVAASSSSLSSNSSPTFDPSVNSVFGGELTVPAAGVHLADVSYPYSNRDGSHSVRKHELWLRVNMPPGDYNLSMVIEIPHI